VTKMGKLIYVYEIPSGGYFGGKEQIAARVAVDENGHRWQLAQNGEWSFVAPGSVWRNRIAGLSGWEAQGQ